VYTTPTRTGLTVCGKWVGISNSPHENYPMCRLLPCTVLTSQSKYSQSSRYPKNFHQRLPNQWDLLSKTQKDCLFSAQWRGSPSQRTLCEAPGTLWEDDPSEEWPAWPFLQLELSLEQVDHICKAQPAERLQVTRNILQNECLISEGDREAVQLFGITDFQET